MRLPGMAVFLLWSLSLCVGYLFVTIGREEPHEKLILCVDMSFSVERSGNE